MFESWVSDLLASSLGHFIDVQRDQLRISLWNGVVIENAQIREDAFDYLQLPFKVHYGCIGKLQLQVPWRALRSSPIIVELSDVTLAASPRDDDEWCGDAAARRAMAAKQAQLAAAELEKLSAKVAAERGGDGGNLRWVLMSHLWSLLLRRLQLSVRNVHILFEGEHACLDSGYAFGLKLASVDTTDEVGMITPWTRNPENVGDVVKTVSVSGLSVYWQATAKGVKHNHKGQEADYILKPHNSQFQINLRKLSQTPTAHGRAMHFEVHGQLEDFHLQISRDQLTEMAHFSEAMSVWMKRCTYGKFRPEGWRDFGSCKEAAEMPPLVDWRLVWQYAVKSVLQDLHDIQPGFSLARLKLWQQWRRRYVSLYLRHVESTRGGSEVDGNGLKELRGLETDLPVSVVMLFRSIAEQKLDEKADVGGSAYSQSSRWGGWLGWGMSGMWGFLGYGASTDSGTPALPEPPSETEIVELYEALDFQPNWQGDNRHVAPAMLASAQIEVSGVHFMLRDKPTPVSHSVATVSVDMTDCELALEMEADKWHCSWFSNDLAVCDWCTCPGVRDRIVERRDLSDSPSTSGIGNDRDAIDFPIMYVSYDSGTAPKANGTNPKLRVRFDPVKIIYRPKCIARLESISSQLPTSQLSAALTRSISRLKTRRARMLAKAQHLSYSQSNLEIEIEFHNAIIHSPNANTSDQLPLLCADLEFLQFVSKPPNDTMDYVRVLRKIEQGHPFQKEGGIKIPTEELERVLFDDLEERLLYQRWEIAVHGLRVLLVTNQGVGKTVDSVLDKLSCTGSLLLNRMMAERSSLAFKSDWRSNHLSVALCGDHIIALNEIVSNLNMEEEVDSGEDGQNGLYSTSGSSDSLDNQQKVSFELSFSTPKARVTYQDSESSDGVYLLGIGQPYCLTANSQTVTLGIHSRGATDKVSVSFQRFHLQDTTNYGGKHVNAKARIPRLAKSITATELAVAVDLSEDGDFRVKGQLEGAECAAYPGEVAGYLKPSASPTPAVGRFVFSHHSGSASNKLDLSLEDGCFGSVFLMRIAAQFGSNGAEAVTSEDNKQCDNAVAKPSTGVSKESVTEPLCLPNARGTAATVGGVGRVGKIQSSSECGVDEVEQRWEPPDAIESFTLNLTVKNCLIVVPKGAQHMAGVLGFPGGHCGALIRIPELGICLGFIDGFQCGQEVWSTVEIGAIHAKQISVMASRSAQSCLLTPLVEIPELHVTAAGSVFENGDWPFVWGGSPRCVKYTVEMGSPKIMLDLESLEVASCAAAGAIEKMEAILPKVNAVEGKQVEKSTVCGAGCCVAYDRVDVEMRMECLNADLVGGLSGLAATAMQLNNVEVQYSGRHVVVKTPGLLPQPAPSVSMPESHVNNEKGNESPKGIGNGNTDGNNSNEDPDDEGKSDIQAPDAANELDATDQGNVEQPCSSDLPQDEIGVGFEKTGWLSWEALTMKTSLSQAESTFHYLTPDGQLSKHSGSSEEELIAAEMENPGMAMALWAPIQSNMWDGNTVGSVSSVASWQTAGSEFSASQRSNCAARFLSADDELPGVSLTRESSFESVLPSFDDVKPAEEEWADATSATGSKGPSCCPSTQNTSATLFSLSTTDNGKVKLKSRESLNGKTPSELSFSVPAVDVRLNAYGWTSTLQTLIDAYQIVMHYIPKSSEATQPSQTPSTHSTNLTLSIDPSDLWICSAGELDAFENGPYYPSVLVKCGEVKACQEKTLSLSLESCSLSSCWIFWDDLSTASFQVQKEVGKLVLVQNLSVEGALKSSRVDGRVQAVNEYSIKVLKALNVWCSYHRAIPLLCVIERIKDQWTVFGSFPDHNDCASPQDDSTTVSAKSSFISSFMPGKGGGLERKQPLSDFFGTVKCELEQLVVRLSDDRSQTEFPLLELVVERLHGEVSRQAGLNKMLWGLEMAPKVGVYNRHKMGWEPFVEPWSLKVEGESTLRKLSTRNSRSNPVFAHTSLSCSSNHPLQLTVSPGMVDSVGVLSELLGIVHDFSLQNLPIPPQMHHDQTQNASFFTTHWLYNETGSGLEFWTSREGLGDCLGGGHGQGVWVDAQEKVEGIPLRAVAMTQRNTSGRINGRQLSLTEISLARNGHYGSRQPSHLDDQGCSVAPGTDSSIVPWFASDFGGNEGSSELETVDENVGQGDRDVLEAMPVHVGVVTTGFPSSECGDEGSLHGFEVSRHRHMKLYFKLDGQQYACGPVPLDIAGRTKIGVNVVKPGGEGVQEATQKDMTKLELICDVSGKRMGGFDVNLHSNVQFCNDTAVKLEVGCWVKDGEPEEVRHVDPGQKMWLPVLAVAQGWICVKPHPESEDPWAMRCAWSQTVKLPDLLSMLSQNSSSNAPTSVFCHLRCNAVSGGLKPVWLNLGAKRDAEGVIASLHAEAPVVIYNNLPLPTEVSLKSRGGAVGGMKGRVCPRESLQGNTIRGGGVDFITLRPEGYKTAVVTSLPGVRDEPAESTKGEAVVIQSSFENSPSEDAIVKVQSESSGGVSVCIRRYVEGFTGRHVFEICCALWVYNCTGIPIALRESRDRELFVDEEAVRVPNDNVPGRWIPPYLGERVDQKGGVGPASRRGTEVNGEGQSNITGGSSALSHSSFSDAVGLREVLQNGDSAQFRIRTRRSADQSRLERNAQTRRGRPSGTRWPWMEVGGAPRLGRLRLQIRTSMAQAPQGDDYWSPTLSVDSLGVAAVVQVPCPIQSSTSRAAFPMAAYFLAVTAHPIPEAGGAWALHVMPRYVLHNTTSVPMQYRQQGVPIERELHPGACLCMHWPNATKPLRLNLRVQEAGWLWSGAVSLESPGDMFVKIRHRHREETILVRVDVSTTNSGVLIVTLSHQAKGFAPYRLDNFTSEKLHVRQETCREQEDILRPYSTIPYAWDEPSCPHKMMLELAGRRHIATLKLDEVGNETSVTLPPDPSSPHTNRRRKLRIVVHAEGPTRVLAIMDEEVHPSTFSQGFSRTRSHEQLGWQSWSAPVPGHTSERARASRSGASSVGFEVSVHLAALGLSLVSSHHELLYAWLGGPQLRLTVGKVRYTLECAVQRFQLDNCVRNAVYPVMARGPIWMRTSEPGHSQAMSFRTSVWRRRPGGVICVEQLHLFFSPLVIEIQENHIMEVHKFYKEHIGPLLARTFAQKQEVHEPDMVLADGQAWFDTIPGTKVYIEHLSLAKLDVTFSFCPASWRFSRQDMSGQGGPGVLHRFLALADVEGARIRLTKLELRHPLLSQQAFLALVGRHYTKSLLQEVYKVVGSADILGDPVRLVHHLGLGVWSLFANPAAALVDSSRNGPQKLAFGVVTGVRSLVSNTIFAFSNATAKLSLTARKALVVLGLEEKTRLQVAHHGLPRHARNPLNDSADLGLVEAVLSGLAGLLSEPVRGAEEGGVVGLLRGTVRGFVGVAVRPLATSLEMSSRIADSIRHFVSGYPAPIPFVRVPRSVDIAAPLQRYNHMEAVGSAMLDDAEGGVYRNDILLGCLPIACKDHFAVVTHKHVLTVALPQPNSPYSFPEVKLKIDLDEVELIELKGSVVCFAGISSVVGLPFRSKGRGTTMVAHPFVFSSIECDDDAVACRLGLLATYACQFVNRRIKRAGHGLLVDNYV